MSVCLVLLSLCAFPHESIYYSIFHTNVCLLVTRVQTPSEGGEVYTCGGEACEEMREDEASDQWE